MSRRIGNIAIIEDEPDKRCEFCGAITDTRPYGPGYKQICNPCAQKDVAGTERRMAHKLFGEPDKEKDN